MTYSWTGNQMWTHWCQCRKLPPTYSLYPWDKCSVRGWNASGLIDSHSKRPDKMGSSAHRGRWCRFFQLCNLKVVYYRAINDTTEEIWKNINCKVVSGNFSSFDSPPGQREPSWLSSSTGSFTPVQTTVWHLQFISLISVIGSAQPCYKHKR